MNERNVTKGLRSPGLFGKKPVIGLTMFIIGSLIFTILAYNLVNQGPLMQWDLPLAQWFHTFSLNSSPLLTNIMIAGYYIGTWAIILIGVILALYFLYKKFWRELVIVVIALGGSGLIFIILSNIFKRPRPSVLFDNLIWAGNLTIPGFPSGHAKSALVLCGLLIYLLIPKIKSSLGKFLVILTALLFIVYIGLSRLYVLDHYLTDIVAGYAVGIAWLGLVLTSVELVFKKYGKGEKEI